MSNTVTEDTLRAFLAARGLSVAPGEDVTATASNVLANLVAEAAAKCPTLVPDPAERKYQLSVFTTAEKGLRSNPFKQARTDSR
jgi:hypothetical protein